MPTQGFAQFRMEFAKGGVEYGNALESLCMDCNDDSRSFIKDYYQIPSTDSNASKEVILLVLPGLTDYAEKNLGNRFMNGFNSTAYGKEIIEKLNNRTIGLSIFFDMAVNNASIDLNEPLWIVERKSVHELFGASYYRNNVGWIALNNYQHPEMAQFTFVHELYHLLDGNLKIGNDIIDDFLSEYRAVLAEVVFYQQFKRVKTPWHGQFKDDWWPMGRTKEEKIKTYVLDLLYPLNPEYTSLGKDTYSELQRILHSEGDTIDDTLSHLKFSSDPDRISLVVKQNEKMRDYIENYFDQKPNKSLLGETHIHKIRSEGFNDSERPRPRGGGRKESGGS